ncbi:hypothetical protein AMK16_08650 [Streptomyces sp. CB00455]|uniref:hypothetical protein n=1 Tax=Streptomyces sp. CB00455 TaxID=1703927 RepID=UPI00093D7107|nr:hypothetical protein [Streptomyces sp. CB00455]OKK20533.1 hypothetical protein AMK16_08650 [Streptomyces sp. CB00455]
MRLRTTAAVFAGALALVLPTAGPSLADDHGGRNLGTLHYRYADGDGDEHEGQIRPAENDTCYVLTRTSEGDPAFEVRNDTESLAVLFDNRNCDGKAERVLEPGQRGRNLEAVSVFFKPAEEDEGRHEGRHEGRDDEGRGDQGRDDEGRGEQGREDEGRGEQGREDEGRGDWNGREDEGRGDWNGREDQARPANGARQDDDGFGREEEEDLFTTVFRSIG